MSNDEEDEHRRISRLFKRLRKDRNIVRCGHIWIDVQGTVGRMVACADGLCMHDGPMRKLAGKTCCTTFRVPLEERDVERVAVVVGEVRKIRDVDRAIRKAGGWWEISEDGAYLKDRPSGACVFLSREEGQRPWCTIHEWALNNGLEFRDHKPETCCLFPLYTLEHEDDTLVTSYGTDIWKESEPEEAEEIHRFSCVFPPAGKGVSVLVEQKEELEYRFGKERWAKVLEKLRGLGHEV